MTAPLRSAPLQAAALPLLRELWAHGDRPALLGDGRQQVSYADLALRVAARAEQLGVTRRLVLLAARPEVDVVVTYLACLAGGHPVLLTGPDPDRTAELVTSYDPDVVVSGGTTERRPGTAHDLHPDLALLLSTSGSTGSPKLVRLSHANLQSNALAIAESLGIRPDDRAITSLPLHYCYGLSVLHSHLARGAATILTAASVVDPCFWEAFEEHRATTLAGVPHTFTLLDRAGFADRDLPWLRYVTQAGGRMPPPQVRAFAELGQRRGFDLVVMYGQTEATARMAVLPPDLTRSRPGAIGAPLQGGSFRLEPVPGTTCRDVGELVYTGPNVMLGYAHGPGDLALGRTVTELRTGDLARRAPDGLYEVVGRRSSFLKVLGHRVDVDQVESRLLAVGHVVACSGSDTELVLATEGEATPSLRPAGARAAGLPLSAVRVCSVPALPRTSSGKLDRAALAVACAPVSAAASRPHSVAGVLGEVLEAEDVLPSSTFVGLGGDSLSYVEASLRLEQLLGALPSDWHLRTVAELEQTPRARGRRGRALETSVLLRALAIVLIVAHHTHVFRVLGGAHLLLGVAGFNFARFQLTRAARADRVRSAARSLRRIVVPAWAVLGLGALAGTYSGVQLLLVHDLVDPLGGNKDFWFIEVLVQTVVACSLLLAVPAVDRFERRAPLLVPTVLLAAGLLARFDVLPVGSGKARIYAPFAVFWLFAWGWAAARATQPWQRLALTGVLLGSLPGFFLDNVLRELVVGGALALLLWVPRVRLPRLVVPVLAVLASSSLYTYVAHYAPARALADQPLLAMGASFLVGLAYWRLADSSPRLVARVRRHRPAGVPPWKAPHQRKARRALVPHVPHRSA